jgi:metallo-beta-lactamase class B
MSSSIRTITASAAALGAALVLSAAQPAISGEAPEVVAQVAQATRLAGSDLQAPLFLCRPDSGQIVRKTLDEGSGRWLEPTRLFDNLFYVGNAFVGVLVVKTSEGLILFDATASAEDARDHLVPGLKALGLEPSTIRYVIVSHGHWDHFGGAAWLQKTYGARIGLSKADWDLIETSPTSAGVAGRPIPIRDLVVTDGQILTLGDTSIVLRVTPGHTPGTVSAIVPAREGAKTYPLSLFGSVAFPPSLEPTPTTAGLLAYDRSVLAFAEASRAAGAVAIFNTHAFADGGLDKLAAARARQPGQPNPFLIGGEATQRYYGVLDACLKAAIARPHDVADATRPTVPSSKD